MAALNYAVDYSRALANAFPYTLYFGALYATPMNGRYRWVNAKTIEIPSITTNGRINADRDTVAFAQRNYDNAWETKTLTNQRKWSTLVHPMDIDQTNMVASIMNITRTFNEFQKFPEMDAYTISTLYKAWITSVASEGYVGHEADETVLTTSNVLSVFDKLMLNMDNARVPVTGRILYVTNEVKFMLKEAQGLYRTMDIDKNGGHTINRVVHSLDDVEIVGVPAELMKTVYNFTRGWAPAAGAAQINMFLVNPIAVITPVSYAFASLQEPTAMSEGKWVYYEESFEDAFILNKQADALQFNITPAGASV